MLTFLLFAAGCAAALVAWFVLTGGTRRSPLWRRATQLRDLVTGPSSSDEPELAPLIARCYASLVTPARMSWWTRRFFVDALEWVIIAAPGNAPILTSRLRVVEADINAALKDCADKDRLVVT